MSIKIKIEGFEEILKEIEAANGSINDATNSALKQSASIMQNELKSAMRSADVDPSLIAEMPPFVVENNGNRFQAKVGYKKGSYDPKNPSAGYKAVFINYGTPRRTKHGKIKERGFVAIAKRKAKPKMKKAQKAAFEKILKRLKK